METKPIITSASQAGLNLIKGFEQLRLEAYQDGGGVWTIGWGIISYEHGRPVAKGDKLTLQQAIDEFAYQIKLKERNLNALLVGIPVTQSQYDALLSLMYNIGTNALRSSTLLRKARVNVNDETIFKYSLLKGNPKADSCEFLKWVRDNGNIVKGLVNRRAAEADMYGKK